MAFLSGFVKSGLSLLGKDSASFPFSVGAKVDWYEDQSIWSLHHGTRKDDGSPVSVFTFDCTKNRDKVALARNAFKRIRTMRHPDLLRYIDGAETDQAIMFVTDPIQPLSNQLNQDPDPNLTLWGLYKVANALKFINNDCGMVHGNVRVASIFINQAGEWKLGGFELLSSMKEESPMILTFGGLAPEAQRYAPPEVKKSGWTAIKDLPTAAIDSYHLGCLIYEAYNNRFDTTDQLLTQRGNIPPAMLEIYRALLRVSPAGRADADAFIDEGLHSFFAQDFVQFNLFLENISIKEQSEREGFFSSIDTFPSEFSKYKILPELVKAFEFGSGGAKSLGAILKIGQHLDNEEYEKVIVDPIVRMFASPDRAIRVSLLENVPKFIEHIPNKAVSNQIFPHVATGFTDTVPIIREQTIKSILYIVPKLNDRIINYDLLKYLAKLQVDEEPGIRTNTTICLGKIAKHLNDGTRKKVLVPAFTRGLRDGFHHARIAALMALMATSDYFDVQECSSRIVPCISQVLIDKEKTVRVQAFKAINVFITRLQEHADKMPETALEPVSATTSPTPSTEASAQAAGVSMTGVFGEATKGLAGWAVSSLNARLSTPSGEINSNPMAASNNQQPQQQQEYRPSSAPISDSFAAAKPASNRLNLAPVDMDDTNGWDNGGGNDGGLIGFEENDGWEPFDAPSTAEPEPITAIVPPSTGSARAAVSTFGSATSSQPTNSATRAPMKLGQTKPKPLAFVADEEEETGGGGGFTNSPPTTAPAMSKEEKRAEMERRREERRQRMAELREKKKGGIGAKKI
ncbi:armadillo-type protein [Zychaea mexicana]|uniref:armadillo-type protein n=1 Tax=Zychaea mexicana TaxID=64656 RepID=UPI0022FEC9C4|nr:armadillo-type protein [Zychaea mexicana]KAI9496704.1 armadillo-type protein [Zychaea mexicana]